MPDFTITWNGSSLYLMPMSVAACLWLISECPDAIWSVGGSVVIDNNNLAILEAVEASGLKAA